MDITFECKSFSGLTQRGNGDVEITAEGAAISRCVDASAIIEEYSAEVLLDNMEDDDIIKYLTEQGHAVTEL
ncbi:hypothetical protein [Morganella morganii]|uniref:hypothetical protein n=1 Tax=Morganella morganii TaxID=582 RepID=UPI0032D9B8FB